MQFYKSIFIALQEIIQFVFFLNPSRLYRHCAKVIGRLQTFTIRLLSAVAASFVNRATPWEWYAFGRLGAQENHLLHSCTYTPESRMKFVSKVIDRRTDLQRDFPSVATTCIRAFNWVRMCSAFQKVEQNHLFLRVIGLSLLSTALLVSLQQTWKTFCACAVLLSSSRIHNELRYNTYKSET